MLPILILLGLAIISIGYLLCGTPYEWRKRKKRIDDLSKALPGCTFVKKDHGWPDGQLMSFNAFDKEGKRVGYYIFTKKGVWERMN